MNPPNMRENPRISVNKLGEYMVAPAGRRRKLLADQKHPPTFMVAYYEDAREAVRDFYRMGGNDERILENAMDRLSARIPESDYEDQKNNSCIEGIAAFLDLLDELDFEAFSIRLGDANPPKLMLAGVDVSVRPELLLETDGATVGAVKFHFSKGTPLERMSAEYIAVTVHRYLEEVLGIANVDSRSCFVIDVFARHARHAPRSYIRRRRDLEAACEEIASRWPAL